MFYIKFIKRTFRLLKLVSYKYINELIESFKSHTSHVTLGRANRGVQGRPLGHVVLSQATSVAGEEQVATLLLLGTVGRFFRHVRLLLGHQTRSTILQDNLVVFVFIGLVARLALLFGGLIIFKENS